jgi:CMP-N-acetylneuraminic acid synthetase
MSKKIGFVPVRIGSKSIPKKNIKNWNNKPLLFWVCDALEKSSEIDEFWIASDSEEINNIFNEFKFSKGKIYNRSIKNSQDKSSTESVLIEFINNKKLKKEDLIVLCQATSPYLKAADIDYGITKIIDKNFDSLLSVVKFERFIWNNSGEALNYDINNRPRRQDMEDYFIENGALYISNVQNILNSKCRLSGSVGYHIMPKQTEFELDEPEDWILSESLFHPTKY